MATRRYIFFDLGWTLEDETQAQTDRAEKAANVARRFGIQTTVSHILALQEAGAAEQVSSVFRYALSQLGLSAEQAESVCHSATWNENLLSLYPDARPVLQQLSAFHFLGLIANQSSGTENRFKRYGIRQYFNLVLPSAEVGLAKPDPAIFRLAQERAGCSADEAWMIGDRIDNDIKPAKEAGWNTIRILHGYNCRQQPRNESERPDHTVSELGQVVGILL